MDIKRGRWIHVPMSKILKVSSRSLGVTQGQMAYHCCMDIHSGGWCNLWMLIMLKVNSRSLGSGSMSYYYSSDIKLGTGIFTNAENVEGQFKYPR